MSWFSVAWESEPVEFMVNINVTVPQTVNLLSGLQRLDILRLAYQVSCCGADYPSTRCLEGGRENASEGLLSVCTDNCVFITRDLLKYPCRLSLLKSDANGAPHPDASSYAEKFSDRYAHQVISGGVGHNLPQEAPEAFSKAIIDVDRS